MNFNNLNTYNDSHERAFEALCNQLFERWIRKEYVGNLKYFTTVNGAGGDGGVEAYAILNSGDVVGVQAKWFRTSLNDSQINQIRKSINSARSVRSNIKRYIVCLPRDFQSDKIGKGKKLITDTEEKRINDLIDEMDKLYPDLILEFWNEHRIREELQKSGNEGVLMFWFEKEELSIDFLKQRFDIAKAGWLKEKYIPSLHCKGVIEDKTEQLLYTPAYREKEIDKTQSIIGEIENTVALIEEFNNLEKANEFAVELDAIKAHLKIYTSELLKITDAIKNGDDRYKPTAIEDKDLWATLDKIGKKSLQNKFKNIQPGLVEALERVHQIDLNQYIIQITDKNQPHNLLMLGGPGTGKTHGVTNVVEKQLGFNFPAIVIRAKGTPNDSWASILHNVLGGLNSWSDAQIFSGLEACATRCDQSRALTPGTSPLTCENEPTKVLIVIDGIDEATDIKTWKIRINELTQWIKDYPRLRFVVTSRQYIPYDMNPCDFDFNNVNRHFDLPFEGAVRLSELAPLYLKEYNINYENTPWIVGAFENVLSIRLFCEQNKGNNLASGTTTHGLAALLNNKIKKIEDEFFEKFSPNWSKTDNVIKKSLFHITETLQKTNPVSHDDLCKYIVTEMDGVVDRSWAARLLDTFSNHAVITKTETIPADGISPVTIDYSAAYQSYLDYFIAITAVAGITNSGNKNMPKLLDPAKDRNIINLAATILLNDHEILVGENDYWVNDMDSQQLQFIQIQALTNASDLVIKKHLPALEKMFFNSMDQRNTILNQFIIPNLHRKELNLGMEFIHKLLSSCPNTFARDFVWSSPDKYGGNEHLNIASVLSVHRLYNHQKHNELPLIFAWSLTSPNNVYRENCKSQLTSWGFNNPQEFIKILDLLFFCGDPQIQEDLAAVLWGIASFMQKPNSGLQELAEWVNKNIFHDTKITLIKNSVVRYCMRALIERAYQFSECTIENVQKARPPYVATDDLLPFDFNSEDLGEERYPIVHDLAWYVIKESFDGFLDHYSENKNKEGEELLKKYGDYYHADISAHDFAMSAGIAFIKSLGWNRDNGPGMTEASHGSKSKIATFEEKYTWLAVHEIQGYLADRVPYKKNNDANLKLTDYCLIQSVPNPAKDYLENPDGPAGVLKNKWHIPDDISPILNYTEATLKNDLKKWTRRKDLPKFSSWINVTGLELKSGKNLPDQLLTLYINTDLAEPNNIGRTALELVCCLIKKDEFENFLNYFKENIDTVKRWPFNDLGHFITSPKCDTYSSVKDVVCMNWMEEEESVEIIEKSETDSFTIIKTVTEVIERANIDSEDYYEVPSKYVRQSLNIVNTDKQLYYTDKEEIVALHNKHGKAYYDGQKFLVVDKNKFHAAIEKDGLRPFWIAFQIQNTTLELKEKKHEFHSQNCRLWLVWEEDGKTKKLLYIDGPFTNK